MPNVIQARCRCGYQAAVPIIPEDDCYAIVKRLRCSQCGCLGRIAEWRVGWMPDTLLSPMHGSDTN